MGDERQLAVDIAHILASAMIDLDDKRRARDNETVTGLQGIATMLGCHVNSVLKLARMHGLPVNHTPGRGYWAKRWQIERWIEAKTEAVEMRQRTR